VSTTTFPSDLEIARAAQLRPIPEIAAGAGLPEEGLEPYGRYLAKVTPEARGVLAGRPQARYVVVTAVTPTPLGEGKTTTAVGLAQGLSRIGHATTLALRQPSLGPTFGIKGGAAGGGYSQVVPMDSFNLHLTGDFHAVTSAHNMLAAMIDNHLHHGNELGLDPRAITWRRVIDVNDRALRNIVIGLGARADGVTRQTGFDITAASEVMVILALTTSLQDMRERMGRIVVGYTYEGEPVTAEQLKAAGAMTALMRDAVKPNLLQTLEHTPVLVHAGPFGNIATGNSSVVADQVGIRMGDFLVTEAGFGADMGAERFFNVKCRVSGLVPDAAVLVATVRSLKAHSGRHTIRPGKALPPELLAENPDEVLVGGANLRKQIENVRAFGVSPVVAINAFPTDHPSEHDAIRSIAQEAGARSAVGTYVVNGGAGAEELAAMVAEAAQETSEFRFLYPLEMSIKEKIETIVREMYGGSGVQYSFEAEQKIALYTRCGFDKLPICMAKTHLSLSHDPDLKGAPTGFIVPIRDVRASVGAGFLYPLLGTMSTMPGLPTRPAYYEIDIDPQTGDVIGLS